MPPEHRARKSKRRNPNTMSQTSSSEERTVKARPVRARSPGARKEDWIASQLRRVYDTRTGRWTTQGPGQRRQALAPRARRNAPRPTTRASTRPRQALRGRQRGPNRFFGF